MKITFFDRNKELKFLEEKFKSNKFEFLIIYGRRRVGKTTLIKEFIKDKEAIYFMAKEASDSVNIKEFKELINQYYDVSFLKDDWKAIFSYLSKVVNKRFVIVIDEFPYLIKNNSSILSLFQDLIDNYLSLNDNIFLIILGSQLSIIEKDLLSYKSPLYGRRTGQLKIKPFSFLASYEFLKKFSNRDIEESFNIYSITDGFPLYLKEFLEKKNIFNLIGEKILNEGSLLNEEAIFLLKEEFSEVSTYFSILSAIAKGKNSFGEIINECGFKDKTSITPYLRKLEIIEIVKKENPFMEKKKAKYYINNNFLNFWFRFIYPNYSLLEINKELLLKKIKENFNSYLGSIFERIVKELILNKPFFPIQQIGKWWWKDKEIDLVAFNEQEKKIAFLECKWQELKIQDVKRIIKELEEKLYYFYQRTKLNRNELEEYLGIVAKEMDEKAKEWLKENGYLVYELKDFEGL